LLTGAASRPPQCLRDQHGLALLMVLIFLVLFLAVAGVLRLL
jgi:hypothetical protein